MMELKASDLDEKHSIRILKFLRFLHFAGWGSFSVFFALYLIECGISYAKIGIIIATPVLVQIFTSTMWGLFSDKIGRRKPFLVQGALVMALFTFAVTLVSSFEWFLILGIMMGLFAPAIEGLMVTSFFKLSGYRKRATFFSSFAVWGAMGWATATALAGVVTFLFGKKSPMYFASFLYLLAVILSLKIQEPREIRKSPMRAASDASTRPRVISRYLAPVSRLLKNKKMLILLLASFPLALATNAFSKFFSAYLESIRTSYILLGLVFAVPAMLEIPVFLHVGKLSDRIGARRPLLIFSASIYSLLFFLASLISSPFLIFFMYSLLEPLAWPLLFTGYSTLISEIVPSDSWVTGQTFFGIWMWNIGGVIGPVIGGFVSQVHGLPAAFTFASLLGIVSCILFFGVKEK
jgi:MFS family permease